MQTDVGSGAGIVRLVQDDGKWKVFTLFTCLMELMGYEEVTGERRPFGVEHGERASRENWLDQRNAEKNFEDNQEPTVLILGRACPFSSKDWNSLMRFRGWTSRSHCCC